MSNRVSIQLEPDKGRVEGFCESRFEPVLDEFVKNFKDRGEIGACACITFEGETVLDVWGGVADPIKRKSWSSDSISVVFSCTKGVVAIVANMLIDRGLLDPHQPVAEIWPEFACKGKESATVRMMLDHTVGVPVLRTPVKPDGFYDWDYMSDLIAAEKAFWIPGSKQGYHATTWGWTVGELIRRVTGKSVGANIQDMLAKPLNLDVWCGLPEAKETNVAPMIPHVPSPNDVPFEMAKVAMEDPTSIPGLVFMNDGGWASAMTASISTETSSTKVDERASHAAEIPAGNGIMNARALAGAYRPFAIGGSYNGVKFVGPDTLVGMEEVSSASNRNETNFAAMKFSLGFGKSMDNRHQPFGPTESLILGRRAFGHPGAGGSLGFADPEFGLSFGYVMNKMGGTMIIHDRTEALLETAYRCAGGRSNASGFWT